MKNKKLIPVKSNIISDSDFDLKEQNCVIKPQKINITKINDSDEMTID